MMTDETMRKLNLMVRLEETLSEILRDSLHRAESDEVRAHMVRLASSHQWHAQALLGFEGIAGTHSEKIDREMALFRKRVDSARDYGDFMDTLSNVEREQMVRFEQLLGEDLEEGLLELLESARRDIEADYPIFLEEAAKLGQA